eukprot:968250-Rhodomonas_salina.2
MLTSGRAGHDGAARGSDHHRGLCALCDLFHWLRVLRADKVRAARAGGCAAERTQGVRRLGACVLAMMFCVCVYVCALRLSVCVCTPECMLVCGGRNL